MIYWLRKLFWPKLDPMNKVKILSKNILHNINYLQSLHPEDLIFPVLKSNAYGHGLVEVVKILEKFDSPYLLVDSLPEYYKARKFTKKKFLLL